VIYRRYASLFFIVGVDGEEENEIGVLEFIHSLVFIHLSIIFQILSNYLIINYCVLLGGDHGQVL